jgi:response regulator of citrate/malate metabolism
MPQFLLPVQVDRFLIKNIEKILEDGQWHTVVEIEEAINLSESTAQKIVEFLNIFKIVDIDVATESLRLSQSFLKLPK